MEINGASPTVINHEILLRKYIAYLVDGLYSIDDAMEEAQVAEGADLQEFTFNEVRYLRELVSNAVKDPRIKNPYSIERFLSALDNEDTI